MKNLRSIRTRFLNKHWGYKRIVRPLSRASLFWLSPICLLTLGETMVNSSNEWINMYGILIRYLAPFIWGILVVCYAASFCFRLARCIGLKRIALNLSLGLPLVFIVKFELIEPFLIVVGIPAIAYIFLRSMASWHRRTVIEPIDDVCSIANTFQSVECHKICKGETEKIA